MTTTPNTPQINADQPPAPTSDSVRTALADAVRRHVLGGAVPAALRAVGRVAEDLAHELTEFDDAIARERHRARVRGRRRPQPYGGNGQNIMPVNRFDNTESPAAGPWGDA